MSFPASAARSDADWMALALEQARHGIGLTSPNPPVGAVIVSAAGELIGQGWHHKAGEPHAEVEAIRDAQTRAPEELAGSTIYVTLEPCSTQGRTPACTDGIREAGIARVIFGASDPSPAHRDRARAVLAASGIEATGGVLQQECEELIRPFTKWITTGLPYVIVKVGQSLDGKITRPGKEPAAITSEEARAHSRTLRARVDAILIGAETLRRDNPLLTLRDSGASAEKLQPWRVVLTRSGNLPRHAHLFTDDFEDRTMVLRDMPFLDVLKTLGGKGIVSLLVEGGSNILEQAFAIQEVDEIHCYIAPRFCGPGARSAIMGGPWFESMTLARTQVLPIGDNVCVSGYPAWNPAGKPQP